MKALNLSGDYRQKMADALKENDEKAYFEAITDMANEIGQSLTADFEQRLEEFKQSNDESILRARGARLLTSDEKKYYNKLIEAFKGEDFRQALTNIVMPDTVITAVFEELQTEHPLLEKINFRLTKANVKLLVNKNGKNEAAWGQLCAAVVEEATSGFKEIETGLFKLSAFLPVCKSSLELGPEWLDAYVREVLYESVSVGLEVGIVAGTGSAEPVGMTRQFGDDVVVTGGVYPEKAKIAVNNLQPYTIGNLVGMLAVGENGKTRLVKDVIFVCNPIDYYTKIMPATTVMAGDGTYRNDVMPFPMTIIPSCALEVGEAVLGIASRYFASAAMDKGGRIEYSDHYQFIPDNRVYLIKLYANGFPMDNNSFLHLDISGLAPTYLQVESHSAPTASAEDTLADLSIGALTLSPTFAAATTNYTASTTNATNVLRAIPADANATIECKLGSAVIDNNAPVAWATGSNTLTVKVTAANGTDSTTYTVTVTKS